MDIGKESISRLLGRNLCLSVDVKLPKGIFKEQGKSRGVIDSVQVSIIITSLGDCFYLGEAGNGPEH